MPDELKDKIVALIEQPLLDEGCELADVALSRYKNKATLRLFVYSAGGVNIDECARLSRILGDIIDGTDYFKSGYTLEVSSPGLDRPLKTAKDFRYRVGEKVTIEFVDRKKKKLTAEIKGASDEEVQFDGEAGEFSVKLAEIEKAKIIF
ncbi:MAG: ribosome maturation factor RimP [Candidatus Zixiibacteriota bacterium]